MNYTITMIEIENFTEEQDCLHNYKKFDKFSDSSNVILIGCNFLEQRIHLRIKGIIRLLQV